MATHFSNSADLVHDVSTVLRAKAFCQFIVDALTAAGWVQTTDTGQLVVGSIAAGFTVLNTKSGYQIWRMADAMQATKPVYVRFDFGTSQIVNCPGMWITIGSGSNGTGTITNIIFNGGGAANATVRGAGASNTTSPVNSYAAGDTGAIRAMLFNASSPWIFSLTRTVDSTGAYNADGVCLSFSRSEGSTGAISSHIAVPHPGGGAAPTQELGMSFVMSNLTSSGYGGDFGVGVVTYFLGRGLQPPGDVIIVNSGDYASEAQFTMTVYGATRTYQLGSFSGSSVYVPTGSGNASLRTNTRVGIRYD